jgi:hypothetical protein
MNISDTEILSNFEKTEEKITQTKYIYEQSMQVEDYDKTLKYLDIYIDSTNQLFLHITLNLDKIEYIQKFIDHIDDWDNTLNDNTREFFIHIITRHKNLDNSFEKVLNIITETEYKSKLLISLRDTEKALEIAKSMKTSVCDIVSKIADTNIDKALDIANNINDNDDYNNKKSKVLSAIVSKVSDTNIDKALDMANDISDDAYKAKAINNISSKTNDSNILERTLKIIHNINTNNIKTKVLSAIALKTINTNIVKALDITNHIPNNKKKSKVLRKIALKIIDTDIYKTIGIAKSISNDDDKATVLHAVAFKDNDPIILSTLIDIANTISCILSKVKALGVICSRTDNPKILKKALEFSDGINLELVRDDIVIYNPDIYKSLDITHNDSNDDFDKVLEETNSNYVKKELIAINNISDDYEKIKALSVIASKANSYEIFNQALEIANSITDKLLACTIKKEIYSKNNTKEYIFNRFIVNTNYKVNKTIEYISHLGSDSTLRYFNINTDKWAKEAISSKSLNENGKIIFIEFVVL